MILGSLVKIQPTEDTEILQSDLNNVIDWSTSNNTELHEKNFESLSYRLPANMKRGEQLPFQNDLTTYTTPSGIGIESGTMGTRRLPRQVKSCNATTL